MNQVREVLAKLRGKRRNLEREGGREGGRECQQAILMTHSQYPTWRTDLSLEDLIHQCIDVASSEGMPQCGHLIHTAPKSPNV